MLTKTEMRFPHKALLTAVMLEEMYAYPREMVRLNYRDRSDGIISGLEYVIRDGDLILTEGLLKFGGDIYILSEAVNISALAEECGAQPSGIYDINLSKAAGVKRDVCLTEERLEIRLVEVERDKADGFTLGKVHYRGRDRFNLPELSDDGDLFEHFFENSYVNVTEVLMSARARATFHPLIFRAVEKFLETKRNKTFMDWAILVTLQAVGSIGVETIEAYIAEEGDSSKITDRAEMLREFFDCLMRSRAKMLRAEDSKDEEYKKPLGRKYGGKMI